MNPRSATRATSVIARPKGDVISSVNHLLMSDFARFINAEVAVLWRRDSAGRLHQISAVGLTAPHPRIARPRQGGVAGRTLLQKRPVLEPLDLVQDAELIRATEPPLTWAVAAPIRPAVGVAGVLIAGFAKPPRDRALALGTAESYATLIGLGLRSPGVLDGLLASARRDRLTGCMNYDALLDEMGREINRSARGGLDLSICFIDLDGFKGINDHDGHLRGNRVLAQVAAILRDGVRSCDSVGRYGGDEFVAILPQTDGPAAGLLAERLRSSIVGANIPSLGHLLTASVGVASWKSGTSAETLLELADTALLAAKSQRLGAVTESETSSLR